VSATLKSRFPQIVAALDPSMMAATKAAAEVIAQRAKDRVPVESGELRDAIHVVDEDEGHSVVAGDTDAFYGHMVEFGTTHTAARPFLIPAAEETRPEVEAAASAALRLVL
jgi:HK97 gp10 family phage protein